jgi:undecaprenyl-diphosphatase
MPSIVDPDEGIRAVGHEALRRISGETMKVLTRLDARDRALFTRWAIAEPTHRWRRLWTAITHLGGVWSSIAAATVPLLLGGRIAHAAAQALATLAISHLIVQLIKRTVGRPRPSRVVDRSNLIIEPDRFSFPSGHAAAAMAVGFMYGCAYPQLALPLILLATAVGMSRVVLGVHYPGDVLVGQILAIVTGMVVAGV